VTSPGADDVNVHGACSGAMTVAAGYLAANQQKLINAAKLNSRVKGVLDGDEMGRVFSWMRPNDLVWNTGSTTT
jgi:polyhydroxyalkanoate synthase subunit PhaC